MIKDYPELIIEIAKRSGIENITSRASTLIHMAETMISKKLRLPEQEKQITLTTNESGTAQLPADLQELQSVKVGDKVLQRLSIHAVSQNNMEGFAILARTLHSTFSQTNHEIIYFANLPSLEAENVNFLLETDPEIYLQAALFQIYSAQNDIDKATTTINYLNLLIEEANQIAKANRYQSSSINFKGIVP